MSIPKEPISVRHCWGQKPAILEIRGGEWDDESGDQSDQFAALARWLRDNPQQWVIALNVEYDEAINPYLTAILNDVGPNRLDGFTYVGKHKEGLF